MYLNKTILIFSAILFISLALNSCEFRTSYSIFQKLQLKDVKDIELSYFPYQIVDNIKHYKYKHLDSNSNLQLYRNLYSFNIDIDSSEIINIENKLSWFVENAKIKVRNNSSVKMNQYLKYKKGEYIYGKFILCLRMKDTNFIIFIQNDFFPKQSFIEAKDYGYRILGNAPKGFFQWNHPKEYCFSSEVLEDDFKNLYNELARYKNKQMINSLKPSDNRDTLQLFPLLE